MKSFKNYIKDNKTLIICMSIIILIMFFPYIFKIKDFVLGYDFQYQHLFFYQDFHRLISSGQMPFWSNNLFLGTNFFASKSYYILGDPFSYITLLFPAACMTYALMVTYILKFITATLLFNHLLFKMNYDNKIRTIGSLLYGFCGWATLFAEHPTFLVWHTFLPLILIGIEYVLKDKKYSIFVVSVTILILSNYYLFFTTSIFLTLYWTLRYYQLNKFNFKSYIIDTLKLIMYYILGVLISSILILPSVLYLVQNSRVSQDIILTNKYNPITIYLDMIIKALIPPFKVSELNHMLFSTSDYNTNQLSLYSSVMVYLMLPQLFINIKNKVSKSYLLILSILFIILIFPIGSSIMHGFNQPNFRWTLLIILMTILAFCHILKNIKLNKKMLLFTLGSYILIILGLRFIANYKYDFIWEHLSYEYNYLLLSMLLLIIFSFIVFNYKKYYKILIVFLVFELSLSSYLTLRRYPDFEDFDYLNVLPQTPFDYIKSIEDETSFYRIYVPYHDSKATMPHNINLLYDYKSAYTYDSLYQPTLNQFVTNDLKFPENTWPIDIHDIDILKQLSFKYFVVDSSDFNLGKEMYYDLPIDLNDHTEFKLIKEIDDKLIYEVTDYTPFPFNITHLGDNNIEGTIEKSDDKYTIPIAYDKGWSISVNNEIVEVINDDGFISFIATESGTISMSFVPQGFKIGAMISLISILIAIYIIKKEH